ncbi:helix-turn-helix domain-containing protein [Zavarzinella formosa]|uniref:helix-turn-helix domain-containing protein n=1 Tax=Zavarzinella formosa TaxID=360055 RepID=UPI0003783B27|nr:hypothetical protein [Zavarzinella formosa]
MKYRPRKAWTSAELALLGKATDESIAAKIDRCKSVVREKRRSIGIAVYKAPAPPPPEKVRKLLGTASDPALADKLRISRDRITTWRRQLGIPPFRKHRPRDGDAARLAEFKKLRKAGWTYPQIAAKHGLSRQRVHQILSGRDERRRAGG